MAARERGAFQPADADGLTHLKVRIGTFNFGMDQTMFQDKPFRNKHQANFQRVLAKLIRDGNLDMCFGCEVGGH